MTYLTKESCEKILQESIATSIKLLCELDEIEEIDDFEYDNAEIIQQIKTELIGINKLIESIKYYISISRTNV